MDDNVIYDLGVDLNSDFTFANGDIALCSYNDNLVQSVVNRLNTDLDELDLFYDGYGSILNTFFGWKATDSTLTFMKSEISNVLSEEPRLTNHECELYYNGNGKVVVELKLYPIDSMSVDVNLVLGKTGVLEIETDEIEIGEEA